MELEFEGEMWFWRGPAPWHFVSVPESDCESIAAASGMVSYGWGMIPVTVTIGSTTFTTSLWPKDGGYIVPIKTAVRTREGLELDDTVAITLRVGG